MLSLATFVRGAKTNPPSKNRVMGSAACTASCTGATWSETQCSRPENDATPTTTASGVRFYGYRYYQPEIGRWLSRDPIGEEDGGVNLYGFVGNLPITRMDFLGLLHVHYAKVRTSSEPAWDWYSDLLTASLTQLAAKIAAFGGKDMYGEPCKLTVETLTRRSSTSSSVDLSSFKYTAPDPESTGDTGSGPDYGILWTKAIGSPPTVQIYGITKEVLLTAKQPRCRLCWFGSYTKTWLNGQGLGSESWISDTTAFPEAEGISELSIASRVMALFRAYRCCRETEEGAEILRLSSESHTVVNPYTGKTVTYHSFDEKPVVKCEKCEKKTPFECK